MLNAVIRLSLRYRMLVIFLSLAALVYGSYVTAHLPIDVFPDLDRPRVVILTEAPNLAPEEIETLISFPIESAVLGATGVQAVRSQSVIGQSIVNIEFDWNVPIFTARQIVQERLTALEGTFPRGIKPQMGPISSLMGQIMVAGVVRRSGKEGGQLSPVGKTKLMAELVNEDTLVFWNPRDRDGRRLPDQCDWTAVSVDAAELTMTVATLGRAGSLASAIPDNAGDKPIVFHPVAGRTGRFQSNDPRLKSQQPRERRLTVTIGNTSHEVLFATPLRQALDLRTTADFTIRPRLLKIPGIAQVMIMGGGRKQYQVLVDPNSLTQHDVTLMQVEEALRKNNLNTSGGYAMQGEKEKPIRVFARLGPERHLVLRDLEQIVVRATPNRNILVKDVARVAEGPQIKRGDCSVNGEPAVAMHIMKQPHRDTRALTTAVTEALREIEATLPDDIEINTDTFQMKNFIDRAVYNVGEALVIGAVMVLVVLFLFLLNFRTTFISLTAIPLSLVVTGIVFKLMSWITGTELSINVMTLGGIAVALGELVDDAIVDVENIFRRLRENNALQEPRDPLRVIYDASVEVRGAIVFGTVMVILVFVPLFALSGMEGRLFAPLGVAYIVSILVSLVVSLTVTPVLSYYLLPQAEATHQHDDSPLLRFLKWGASYLIVLSMEWAGTLLAVTWVLVVACAWLVTQVGADFLPPFDEGTVQINLTLPSGSSLDASNRTAAIVDAKFRKERKSADNPNGKILQFLRRSGRPENFEEADPVNVTEYFVVVNPALGRKRADILKEMLEELQEALPGVDIEDEQPLQHLIGHMLTGVKAQIAVKVFGDDLDVMRKSAERIKRSLQTVPGITDPVIEAQGLIDEMHIKPRPDRLAYYGVDRAFVADFIATALKGEEVTQVIDGHRRFDVIVRLDDRFRTDYARLHRLRLELPEIPGAAHAGDGKKRVVALSDLATFHEGIGANEINRENARRRLVIKVNTQGRDLAGAVAEMKAAVRHDVTLPPGYSVEFGGQFENQVAATNLILILSAVSVVGMFVVLYMLFPSTRIVLQILNSLPTAFIGGVLALVLTQQKLNVASMVGFVSLGGIAARNGILLVTHYFHLMKHEGESFSEKMIMRGSLERLSPVLMTALTAGIGLVPLVWGGQEPGREILYPVATVILGGLITSTICEFLIHPGIFWRFSGKDADALVQQLEHEDELELAEEKQ